MFTSIETTRLDHLKKRGPWTVHGEQLYYKQVESMYREVPRHAYLGTLPKLGRSIFVSNVRVKMGTAVGGEPGCRRWDRALTLLKMADLVRYDRAFGSWVKVLL